MDTNSVNDNATTAELSFQSFLESIPPGKMVDIKNLCEVKEQFKPYQLLTPQIRLFCDNENCNGFRFFFAVTQNNLDINDSLINSNFLTYLCRNCRGSAKRFSITSVYDKDNKTWKVEKYGEKPPFGPPTPARVYKFIGEERDLFLMGRRCEIQGMGIGAFVYYRRVIENQKDRIFDEILRVVSKISPDSEVIQELTSAKQETQFTKAVESIKHALPQVLFINGYNPLTLLHSALSEGVHAHDDSGCLELAADVRTVLFEFAERLGEALKEEAALNSAVNRLANKSRKN